MTSHRRRDRFPLSVILMITIGVCAVYPALVADRVEVRRIAFAVALVLLALSMFILGIQIWNWVRITDGKLRAGDRLLDSLQVKVDALTALARYSPAHREQLADGSPPDGGPPTRLAACRSRGVLGRLWRGRPGAASAAAAGILVAAGAAGAAMLILVPSQHEQPAGAQAGPTQPPPSTGLPASTVPPPGEQPPVDAPYQPVIDVAPPTTVTVTVTETFTPLPLPLLAPDLGPPARSQRSTPPSSAAPQSPAPSSQPATVGAPDPCVPPELPTCVAQPLLGP